MKFSNIQTLKCYKLVLSFSNIYNNIGRIIMTIKNRSLRRKTNFNIENISNKNNISGLNFSSIKKEIIFFFESKEFYPKKGYVEYQPNWMRKIV